MGRQKTWRVNSAAHARKFRHISERENSPSTDVEAVEINEGVGTPYMREETNWEGGVSVKRWLREHCDYTFSTLQENMLLALASVDTLLIRKWQNRFFRWLDAYRGGLSARDAQLHVRAFSSRKYKSHRRVPENTARILD